MLKVCQISSVHPTFDTRIFHKECKTLAKAGYEVVLVIPHDRNEEINGVRIRAMPQIRKRWQRLSSLIWQIYGAALEENARIYHFHDPELIPLGFLLKLHGKKVIYDVHEDYAGSLLRNTRKDLSFTSQKVCSKIVRIFEFAAARCFDALVTATPFITGIFSSQNTALVQNYPLIGELSSLQGVPYQQRANNLCYIGGIAEIRGIREMVQATALVSQDYGITLYLGGEFVPAELLEELKKRSEWRSVKYLGRLSRADVAKTMFLSKIGLILFHPAPNHIHAQPNKLFECMSAGLPVIASSFPRWREIVDGCQCGLVVDPLQPQAIAEAITWMFDHPVEAEAMGQRGKKAVEENFNWDKEAASLLDLYKKILS